MTRLFQTHSRLTALGRIICAFVLLSGIARADDSEAHIYPPEWKVKAYLSALSDPDRAVQFDALTALARNRVDDPRIADRLLEIATNRLESKSGFEREQVESALSYQTKSLRDKSAQAQWTMYLEKAAYNRVSGGFSRFLVKEGGDWRRWVASNALVDTHKRLNPAADALRDRDNYRLPDESSALFEFLQKYGGSYD